MGKVLAITMGDGADLPPKPAAKERTKVKKQETATAPGSQQRKRGGSHADKDSSGPKL